MSKFFGRVDSDSAARRPRWQTITRLILLSVLAFLGLIMFIVLHSPARFTVPREADFAQDYVMGRAILAGEDPYASLDTLTPRFGLGFNLWRHPCPHPPPFALLMTPLALLPYGSAMFVWLLLSEMGLLLSLRILFNLKWVSLPIWFLISLLWYPIQDDFAMGQLMTVMLTLLVLGFISFRSGQQVRTGIFIGLALCIKLFVWPFVIYFLLKRKFRAAAAAAGVFIAANVIAGIVIGFDRISYYFFHVGGIVVSIYRGNPLNYSIFSIGTRLFVGTRSTFTGRIESAPLMFAPEIATPISLAFALVTFIAVFYFLIRCRSEEHAFAALVCLSIILSPLAWWFYFVLLLIPFSTAPRLRVRVVNIALGTCLIATYIPRLIPTFFGIRISFWVGLLLLFPLFAVGFLTVALLASCNGLEAKREIEQN